MIDLSEGTPGPLVMDLQHQITQRRHKMDELERRSQLGDRSDVLQQMEEMREQIRRLEAQQQTRWGSPNSDPFGDSLSPPGSMTTREREQPSLGPPEPELLIHSDSGLRMNSHTGLLELPPSYDAE
jgi:hypothetical protein